MWRDPASVARRRVEGVRGVRRVGASGLLLVRVGSVSLWYCI